MPVCEVLPNSVEPWRQADQAEETANWPIQQHWIRVISMAAAWSGLNPDISANYTGSEELLAAAKKGMDWWFARDFSELACMGAGGDKQVSFPSRAAQCVMWTLTITEILLARAIPQVFGTRYVAWPLFSMQRSVT